LLVGLAAGVWYLRSGKASEREAGPARVPTPALSSATTADAGPVDDAHVEVAAQPKASEDPESDAVKKADPPVAAKVPAKTKRRAKRKPRGKRRPKRDREGSIGIKDW
jgi:hypothetical protein